MNTPVHTTVKPIELLAEYVYGHNNGQYLRFEDHDIVLDGMSTLGVFPEMSLEALIPYVNGEINRMRLREE